MLMCKYETKYQVNPSGQVSYGVALFDLPSISALHDAVMSTNITILRRTAPYAYIIIYDDPDDPWLDQSPTKRDPYAASLDALPTTRKGLNIAYPTIEGSDRSVIVNVGCGDLLPFVSLLEQDRACLLCFPKQRQLQEIAEIIRNEPDNEHILMALLKDGGFLLTTVDSWVFQMMTLDPANLKHFGYEEGKPLEGRWAILDAAVDDASR